MTDPNPKPIRLERPREECGVFAAHLRPLAAESTALGLHALQHRGQEAAGIAAYDGKNFRAEKRRGLVSDSFFKAAALERRLPGASAIGHVRYATRGEAYMRNVQPLFAEFADGGAAICHNGNLTNADALRAELVGEGAIFQSTSDTETALHLMARSRKHDVFNKFLDAVARLEGAFALAALSDRGLLLARDRRGIRPLAIGRGPQGEWFAASETCALDIVGATFEREVDNGEAIFIDNHGHLHSRRFASAEPCRPCLFEFVYFSRPDSILDGRNVYESRRRMGEELAEETAVDVDVAVAVPDSGVPAALGYAEAAKIPYVPGLVRNHYVGRTFIAPEQRDRAFGVRLKHNPNRAALKGRRIALIDDSLVRGTTSRQIVAMVREAGATEVHMRIAAPPVIHPDYYGIDMPDAQALISATRTADEVRDLIGADSLAFLSLDGLYRAMGEAKGRDPDAPRYTDHYFSGDYPDDRQDASTAGDAFDPKRGALLVEEAS